jgi:uncharacterized protein YkwD
MAGRSREQQVGAAVIGLAKLALVGFAVVGALTLFQPAVLGVPDMGSSGDGGAPAASATPSAPTATADPTATPTPGIVQQGYNLNRTEALFIELLNKERNSRGLQAVSQRDVLTEMGREHSANMAEYDYIGHEEPDGTTIEGRYRNRGLLPECRLPTEDGRYYAGAENAAHYWVDETVDTSKGDLYVGDERDLARGLFRSWMSSPPHRRAMLVASADDVGLGLYIDERGKVYASLELC